MSDFETWWNEYVLSGPTMAVRDIVLDAWNAALARALQQQWQAWQDISTAPRDGTFVMLYDPTLEDDACIAMASWQSTGWYGIYDLGLTYDSELYNLTPTHWQPLPQPPKGPDHE